jgi:hypothetical protein
MIAATWVLAGCAAGTSNGFSAQAPAGWEDRTDTAESRTGTDFEVVWEGAPVEGFRPIISVARVESDEALATAAARARVAVARRFEGVDRTDVTPARLAGEPAQRFDYAADGKRTRYLTARRGAHLYSVSVQAAESGFERARQAFDAYLASWRWE